MSCKLKHKQNTCTSHLPPTPTCAWITAPYAMCRNKGVDHVRTSANLAANRQGNIQIHTQTHDVRRQLTFTDVSLMPISFTFDRSAKIIPCTGLLAVHCPGPRTRYYYETDRQECVVYAEIIRPGDEISERGLVRSHWVFLRPRTSYMHAGRGRKSTGS